MHIEEDKKHKIIQEIQKVLCEEEGILFVYLHGSFLSEDEFNDIDVALYMDEKFAEKIKPVDFEISWSLKLEKYLKVPADVKLLNFAPLSFRYHASCGQLLFSHDESIREEFLCRTWSEYFDFKPVAEIYLKEISTAKI